MNTDQNRQTDEAELDNAMAPFMALPVATPQMILALGHYIIRKRKEEETRREESHPAPAAAWMTVTQLAAHFGYHRVTMHRILSNYLDSGKVHFIQPKGSPMQKGDSNRRYSVADVTAAMMKETKATAGKEVAR